MNSPLSSEVIFWLGPMPMTMQIVVGMAITAALGLGSWWLSRRLDVEHPSAIQALAEWFVESVDAQIRDVTHADPMPYQPLLATLFLFILTANLSSLLPGVEPPTAALETDLVLAAIVFVAAIVFGVRARGWRAYLRSFAEPSWVMVPLNLIEQLTRTFSLTVRLFGNVMSGAFVIGIVASLAGLLVPIPFMALELLTGIIQAYIFTVLATVFIGAAIGESQAQATP